MFKFLESLIHGTRQPPQGTPPPGLLAFYWHFIGQTPWPFFGMVLASLGVALVDMCIPVFIGRLVALMQVADRAAALHENAAALAGMVAVVLIGRPLLQFADIAIRLNAVLPGVTNLIRWQSHWHVVRQSWPFFQKDFAGRIANRVMQTAQSLRESVMSTVRAVLYSATYGVSAIVLMAGADWRLALPTLVWLVTYGAFLHYFVPRLRDLARANSEQRSLVMGRVVDSYSNILTVKLFATFAHEDAYIRDVIDDHQAAMAAHMRMTSRFMFTLQAMNALLMVSTAIIGIGLWATGQIGAGVVAMALPLAWQITNTAGWVSFEVAGIFENIGSVQEGMETIAVPHTLVDAPDAEKLEVTQGEIRFEQVKFGYSPDKPVIEDLNLAVRPGERVGLVGRSGAGKTTLVNLLLRFQDINAGRITIDSQDISHVTQESLRAAVGMVTQDTSLLHRSIAANISYGKPQASPEQIAAAARRAQAHDFIVVLHDWQGRSGYQAHVGERGVKLSGGQRQRIALARVILKDAPILILDEATSALDSEIEVAIQEQLQGLMDGKTVIAIAHRLSTIARMDRLIVLDHGRIVEQGSHEELLRLNGHYAALWRHQSGGFLPDLLPEDDQPAR
jgi:ATP-binding cassette subfamily B multidrug efflux pump